MRARSISRRPLGCPLEAFGCGWLGRAPGRRAAAAARRPGHRSRAPDRDHPLAAPLRLPRHAEGAVRAGRRQLCAGAGRNGRNFCARPRAVRDRAEDGLARRLHRARAGSAFAGARCAGGRLRRGVRRISGAARRGRDRAPAGKRALAAPGPPSAALRLSLRARRLPLSHDADRAAAARPSATGCWRSSPSGRRRSARSRSRSTRSPSSSSHRARHPSACAGALPSDGRPERTSRRAVQARDALC